MTDTVREPGDTGTPGADSATNQEQQQTDPPDRNRSRSRGRGRGRRGSGSGRAADERSGDPASSDPSRTDATSSDTHSDVLPDAVHDPAPGADPDEGEGGGRRRRRRGRRGRGRGKGRGSDTTLTSSAREATAADDPEAVTTPAPDVPDTDKAPSDATSVSDGEPSGGASRSRSSGRNAEGKGEGKGSGGRGSGRARTDEAANGASTDVEQAISRGGTRMAAKKGNRRANGGGGRRGQQRPGGVPEEVRRAILEGPPRTMLVTAREDRTQIAVMEDRTVVEHYVTRKEDVTYVGNIYMGRVQNVLPGMEAAFLDIGKGRNGVLYAGEVLYDELDLEEGDDQRIENVLKPGQTVLVQVTKDPMGSKGPRLTMHLSLAGRYMVLAPDSELFGISRKLTDKERDRLRRIVKKVKPDHHGVIVRTAAEGATEEQITADIERLLAKWKKVEDAAADAKALTAVYEEPRLVVKVIRDNFGPEFERCIVDDDELFHAVRGYLDEVAPELLDKVELYGAPTADAMARAAGAPPLATARPAPVTAPVVPEGSDGAAEEPGTPEPSVDEATDVPAADATAPATEAAADTTAEAADTADAADTTDTDTTAEAGEEPAAGQVDAAAAAERRKQLPPLFEAYDVADQLRKAMGKKVWLPSGGYLIIESTEAMKVIDVNTGKFTGGKNTNLEEVVLKTNLEAADEIVRQLRLRDMGGIIVIDFIDMLLKANQDQVVRRLKRELLRDRTKTRVSEVSRLGLVQMTRKNVSQGLVESFSHTCETCEGRGVISEID